MSKYNDGDVRLQEKVYLEMRPYIDHPQVNSSEGITCNHCMSNHLQLRGYLLTKSGIKYRRFQCQECGAWGNLKKREKYER